MLSGGAAGVVTSDGPMGLHGGLPVVVLPSMTVVVVVVVVVVEVTVSRGRVVVGKTTVGVAEALGTPCTHGKFDISTEKHIDS